MPITVAFRTTMAALTGGYMWSAGRNGDLAA